VESESVGVGGACGGWWVVSEGCEGHGGWKVKLSGVGGACGGWWVVSEGHGGWKVNLSGCVVHAVGGGW
jgi:hypothetical protein